MTIESTSHTPEKEETPPIFQVRFGFGVHGLNYTNWSDEMIGDMEIFFQSADQTARNVFFMEDATGSEQFVRRIRRAYRHYGSYTTAWAYANGHWDTDGFPNPAAVNERYKVALAASGGGKALTESLGFVDKVFAAIDSMVQRGRPVELVLETRRDQREENRIQDIVAQIERYQERNFTSADDFRKFMQVMHYITTFRDMKVAEDLANMHKKALKTKQKTRVYIFMGKEHDGTMDLLRTRLSRKSSYQISSLTGHYHEEYQAIDEATKKAFEMLDKKVSPADDEWRELYDQYITPRSASI